MTRLSILGCALGLLLLSGCQGTLIGGARVTAWVVDDIEELRPDSSPRLESDVFSAGQRRVRLSTARNETVAVQLVLSADGDSGPLDVRVGAFRPPPGPPAGLPEGELFRGEWTVVSRFPAWQATHVGGAPEAREVIDALAPWSGPRGGPITVRGGRREVVWIDIHTPSDASVGLHEAELVVSAGRGSAAFSALIELQVLDVTIPARRAAPLMARLDVATLLHERVNWPRRAPEEISLIRGEPAHERAVAVVDESMRLLRSHRLTPVLWGAFPKYTVLGPREVSFDWEPYDALIGPYLSGAAFEDDAGLERWTLPLSDEYPSAARNGGVDSPEYARLLAACLRAADAHFVERGWGDRALLRIAAPRPLTAAEVRRIGTLAEIVRLSESPGPLLAFLPPQSPRALGWRDAPDIPFRDVGVWCPPGMLFDPSAVDALAAQGREVWLRPDHPPYSPSLAIGAPATDPATLPWAAARGRAGGVWIEDVLSESGDADPLLSSDRAPRGAAPWPTARLKRLRRGAYDADLLALLRDQGKSGIADFAVRRIVRWLGSEAALDDLVSTRPTGWSRDAFALARARDALRLEAAGMSGSADALWRRVAALDDRVDVTPRGARLVERNGVYSAAMSVAALNRGDQPRSVRLDVNAPEGWRVLRTPALDVAPGGFMHGSIDLAIERLSYNPDGLAPVQIEIEGADQPRMLAARVAVTAVPFLDHGPRIDGSLDDWRIGVDNQLGDFRLVNPGESDAPALPTRAAVCMDAERLYVAIEATLQPGQRPVWSSANVVPVQGAMPWGEDLLEILLSPTETAGGGGDLYVVQIKPSGLVIATRGARTEPPMNPVLSWTADVRCATRVTSRSWIAEVSIPLAAFGPDARQSRIWGLNVTRLDARRGEYSSWSGTQGQCYAPDRLGNVVLLAP